MSYPPSGPPNPYQGGGYPASGGGYPGDRPPGSDRSPWSSPAVIVAIAAGVLIVVGGVLAAVLLLPGDSDTTAQPSATSSATTPSPSTVTNTVTTAPGGGAGPTTTPPTTRPRATPSVAGADWQGFTDGPRCNAADDPAVVIGQTARSRVVICQVGDQVGRMYYKGLADGNAIEVQYPTRVGNTYEVLNNDVKYIIAPGQLTIVQNGETVATEPMLAYWTSGP